MPRHDNGFLRIAVCLVFMLAPTFLHAQSVAFEWPGSGVPFHASAPLPGELAAVLDAITPMKRRAPPRKAPKAAPRGRVPRR